MTARFMTNSFKKRIKPISNWAFWATKNVLKDPKKLEKFDVMVIDEIQDIYPPVVTYLFMSN